MQFLMRKKFLKGWKLSKYISIGAEYGFEKIVHK